MASTLSRGCGCKLWFCAPHVARQDKCDSQSDAQQELQRTTQCTKPLHTVIHPGRNPSPNNKSQTHCRDFACKSALVQCMLRSSITRGAPAQQACTGLHIAPSLCTGSLPPPSTIPHIHTTLSSIVIAAFDCQACSKESHGAKQHHCRTNADTAQELCRTHNASSLSQSCFHHPK